MMASVVPRAWKIQSFDDVKRLWLSVRSVPMRTQGRKHDQEDRYCLGLYLLALGTYRLVGYPFQVEQGESPDFMATWSSGEVTGLEVTRATTQWLQRAMTGGEREYLGKEVGAAASAEKPEPVISSLDDGLVDGEAETKWCSLVRKALEGKLEKLPGFRPASRYDLLIYDDTPIVGVDRRKVVATLNPWIRSLDVATLKLGTVSVIISPDVLFDLGGSSRVLPYINWDVPELNGPNEPSDLPERIEYAGWHAAKGALRGHAKEHNPVYSIDSRGRLVKQTSDGQRFEVRVGADGAEIVVARLS
ncbi:MAG: hypothetical protein ACHQ9S_20225 [Candidatus Binatia bacterium]